MKYKFMVIMVFVYALLPKTAYCQVNTPVVNLEKKSVNATPLLLGRCDISAFNNAPYNEWFQKNYTGYTLDSTTVVQLKPLLKEKKIDIFMGTWCGDSKWEVPRMIKLLRAAGFDSSNLAIVCVSNEGEMYKKSPQGEEVGKNIVRVPTLIVYEKKQEIGRIIESPVVSLEKDLLRILLKDGYTPNYATLKN